MDLEMCEIWSPDLARSGELPADARDYRLFVQVALGEKGRAGHEVFGLTVCSPSQLHAANGQFVTHTLVMDVFAWEELARRLLRLLAHVGGCKTWGEVIARLAPYLSYNDADE